MCFYMIKLPLLEVPPPQLSEIRPTQNQGHCGFDQVLWVALILRFHCISTVFLNVSLSCMIVIEQRSLRPVVDITLQCLIWLSVQTCETLVWTFHFSVYTRGVLWMPVYIRSKGQCCSHLSWFVHSWTLFLRPITVTKKGGRPFWSVRRFICDMWMDRGMWIYVNGPWYTLGPWS